VPERSGNGTDDVVHTRGVLAGPGPAPPPGTPASVALMARRSAQSVLKRAREQALREKRELKQAKKDARSARRRGEDPIDADQADAAPADAEPEPEPVEADPGAGVE